MTDTLIREPSVTELLAEIEAAEKAPEPGTVRAKDVLHKGDDDVPALVRQGALTSAGYAYIYDTRTGDRSLTNRNMLPTQLKKVREDGSRVFTVHDPGFRPASGQHRCMLHADRAERDEYTRMGLPTCRKANLLNEFEVELHMQHRHPKAWKTIEAQRQRLEKEADRAIQQAILQQMQQQAGAEAVEPKTARARKDA